MNDLLSCLISCCQKGPFPDERALHIKIKYKHYKNFLRVKQMLEKVHCFFFWELQFITVLLLIHESYMNWSKRFVSLKSSVGFSIFDSVSFLLKFTFFFFFKKSMDSPGPSLLEETIFFLDSFSSFHLMGGVFTFGVLWGVCKCYCILSC